MCQYEKKTVWINVEDNGIIAKQEKSYRKKYLSVD